jgi:hypothetical protein
LKDAQDALSKAKDEELTGNLKDKDVHIADADEKAAEARATAAKAGEGAAKANERAQNLEQENIKLRTDLENATAESRSKQTELTREQQVLTREQQRTAEEQGKAAESIWSALWELSKVRSLQTPRRLVKGQNREEFIEGLKVLDNPKGTVEIIWAGDSFIGEPRTFAEDIADALREGEWIVAKVQGVSVVIGSEEIRNTEKINEATGIKIAVRDPNNPPPAARALEWAFLQSGFVADFVQNKKPEDEVIRLRIWQMPPSGGRVLRFGSK